MLDSIKTQNEYLSGQGALPEVFVDKKLSLPAPDDKGKDKKTIPGHLKDEYMRD